ncbi:MAG: cytochrome P450 [Polyangiales bacterium]
MPASGNSSALPLPPGSRGLPFVGETPAFLFDKDFAKKRHAAHGPIVRTHLFGRDAVLLAGPEACRFVLSTGMHHFSWGEGWPSSFKALLGQGLFVQDGEVHARNRAALAPAFHGRALATYLGPMESLVIRHAERWAETGTLTWYPELKRLTFAIAGELLLGLDEDDGGWLARRFTELVQGLFALPLPFPGTAWSRALRARDAIHTHLEQAIERRERVPREDALGLLVGARDGEGNRLARREIRDHALLLAFAGHDTTTSMLASLLLRLAQHPDVLARCRAEQDALALGPTLTVADHGRMSYLDQVLREIERLHPPVPGGFRGVVEPFEWNGSRVPKGFLANYQIALTHRDARVYDDPERFDPERFSQDRAEHKRMAFSLLGFGGGPRICLGMGFAQMELKLVASHLLRSFEWELLPGQDLTLDPIPTLHPRDGLRVRLRRR